MWNEWMHSDSHAFTPSGNRKKPELVTIAHWIKVAWDKVDPNIIRRGFKKCCLTNLMDGTEDSVLWEDGAYSSDEQPDVIDIETEAMYHEEEQAEIPLSTDSEFEDL